MYEKALKDNKKQLLPQYTNGKPFFFKKDT